MKILVLGLLVGLLSGCASVQLHERVALLEVRCNIIEKQNSVLTDEVVKNKTVILMLLDIIDKKLKISL